MPPSKPHWFTIKDLLFPGSLALLSIVATIAVFLSKVESATPGTELPSGPFGVRALMVVVTLAFIALYVRLLWLRHRDLKSFLYVRGPFYSVMVHPGGYQGSLEPAVIIGQFHTAFDQWQKTFSWEQILEFADSQLFWVWLEAQPVPCGYGSKRLVHGYKVTRSRKIVVGYKTGTEPLAATSLQHEIGHVLQGELTGSWMTTAHHDRAKKFGIR